MKRLLLVLVVACDTRPLPAPPEPTAPSASVTPATARSTPFAAVSAIIGDGAPTASAKPPVFGLPTLDLECKKDEECAATFYDDSCCSGCEPRVGTKAATKRIDAFCVAHRAAGCTPKPCGFVLGAPRCMDGKCLAR